MTDQSTPYILDEVVDLSTEFFTDTNNKERINSDYSDRPTLLKAIVKLYKVITLCKKKQTWEKTEEEVHRDMQNAKGFSNLDMQSANDTIVDLKQSTGHVLTDLLPIEQIVKNKIESIVIFVDFAFIYWIRKYSNDNPFYQLPKNRNKFNLIVTQLKIPHDQLYKLFKQLIKNKAIIDFRNEIPFQFRTDLSHWEIYDMIEKQIPCLKLLLSLIFAL